MKDIFDFYEAEPVWADGLADEMNVSISFEAVFSWENNASAILRLTGAQIYRILVNGAFAGYGPARAPKGFVRLDEWDLSPYLKAGDNHLSIEVASYRCLNYYLPNVPPFLQAEVLIDGAVSLSTPSGFKGYLMPRVRKVPRYSFQRCFSEVWQLPRKTGEPLTLVPSEYGAKVKRLASLVPHPDVSMSAPFKAISRLACNASTDIALDAKSYWQAHRDDILEGKFRPFHKDYWFWYASGLEFSRFSQDEIEYDLLFEHASQKVERVDAQVEEGPFALKAGDGILFDAGAVDTGFISLKLHVGKAPAHILFTFDEVLAEDGLIKLSRYACTNSVAWDFSEPGDYVIESFEPYTFRYCYLTVKDGEVNAEAPSLRGYRSPLANRPCPEFGDAALSQIFEAARSTFAQNTVDVFTDCPGRERAGWLCDSFWTARVSEFFTGSTIYEDLFLENYAVPESFEDIPDGMLPMCYPADFVSKDFIPNWAMWLLLQLEEYLFVRGGKREIADMLKPRVLKLIDYFKGFENEDGLLEKLSGWIFVEWSKANSLVQDVNYPTNMLWASALDAVAHIYDMPEFSNKANAIRDKIREQSFDGMWFHDCAKRGEDGKLVLDKNCTETCQYYAFYFHTATPETHENLWEILLEDFGPDRGQRGKFKEIWPSNAFIGNYLRLELISRKGLRNKIIEESKGFFKYMADRTGTLWENIGTNASCCHGFASHVAVLLARDIMGLDISPSDIKSLSR